MKVKVIKSFKDKHKKTLYKKNDVINITKERFEEINSAARGPFVEEIKKSAKSG